MAHPIHALDSFFYTSMGTYAFESQCEMLAEIGYNGITVAAWGGTPLTDLSLLPGVKVKHGLDVSALYLVLHEGRNDEVVRRIVDSVEGTDLIELAIQTSMNGPSAILEAIEEVLKIAEKRQLKVALYPHAHHVTRTTSQVVQICERFDHSRLGASFNAYHWYANQEGDLEACLSAMKPWLMQVVTSGASLSPLGWGGLAHMEPIDRGELDNFALIAALERVGYNGSLGVLGWDYCGDVYLKLERCLLALREMEKRLVGRPRWSELLLIS